MEMNFNDLSSYNSKMAKSWYDKVGFVDKIFEPIDIVVDFGCANGAVTRFIKSFYNGTLVVGYDLSEVLKANHLRGYGTDMDEFGVRYTSDFTDIKDYVQRYRRNGKAVLVMNSVMHEIYNYMAHDEIIELFNTWFCGLFDYIWVRDMFVTRPADNSDYGRAIEAIKSKPELNKRFNEFCAINGDLENDKNWKQLTHFLMKCRFDVNWEREVKEDYLAFVNNYPEFRKYIGRKYDTTYYDMYLLQYIQYINKKELDIDLRRNEVTTHFRAVYKLKEE